jgi:hypothetical protein
VAFASTALLCILILRCIHTSQSTTVAKRGILCERTSRRRSSGSSSRSSSISNIGSAGPVVTVPVLRECAVFPSAQRRRVSAIRATVRYRASVYCRLYVWRYRLHATVIGIS